MTILILHGITGHAGIHWQQWLHDQLEAQGQTVIMPSLSETDHPSREKWLQEVRDALDGVDVTQLVLVGHSLGVATALDFIEQSSKRVHGLVSVSGFAVDYGAELNSYFMREKDIDLGKVRQNVDKIIILYGDDDPYVTRSALQHLADGVDVKPIVVEHGGHLNAAAGYATFPRLLEAVQTIL